MASMLGASPARAVCAPRAGVRASSAPKASRLPRRTASSRRPSAFRLHAVDADDEVAVVQASPEEVAEVAKAMSADDIPDAVKTVPKAAVERDLGKEVESRRTFAIISHPDAGKTTLTEKLLYYGGAIQEAGAVRARRGAKAATSDWMEMEKQRGISISSTALSFAYKKFTLNLLDTPGHADFGGEV